jgi:anti-sigma regulatory factor (Ser/Thr protein kinase)
MENDPDLLHLLVGLQSEQTRLRLPSRPDLIESAVEYLRHKAVLVGVCPPAQSARLGMALHEALSNSVVHGNLEISSELREGDDGAFARALAARSADPEFVSRVVEITVDFDGTRCEWTLTDQGKGFDVDRVKSCEPANEADLLRPSGRGILMMRALMDEVRYEAGGRRVTLTLRRRGEEHRQETRVEHQFPVQVAPIRLDGSIDWQAAQEGISRNLSLGGMAVFQAKLAATHRVLIAMTTEGHTLYVPAEIRHCRSIGDGMVELGCRFQPGSVATPSGHATGSSAEAEEAIGLLIDRFQGDEEVQDERRAHPRVAYSERVEITGTHPGEPTFGFARNLSRGGIAFITTSPLSLEEKGLSLRLKGQGMVRVRAAIIRCVKIMEGFYDIGARFVGLDVSM